MSNSNESKLLKIMIVILSAVLLCFGTYIATWEITREQQNNEQHNVAQAIYIDIFTTSDRISSAVDSYNLSLNDTKDAPVILLYPQPFYTDNGLYFSFINEISRFDSNLSANVYKYYLRLSN